MNARFEQKPERIPDSAISRSPEQAMQAEIELLAGNIAAKEPKMQVKIMHDLHLAQHGIKEQVAEARQRLSKLGISNSWPVEILAILETRVKEAKLGVTGPDYKNDPKYQEFNNLFKSDKPESSVN